MCGNAHNIDRYENERLCLQESIKGVLCLDSPTDYKHDGITLTMDGMVNLTISPKNVGVFDAFYSSVKVILKWILPVLIR